MTYIIAELGVNFEHDMKDARKMVMQAKKAGANAVKTQAYRADDIANKGTPEFDLFKRTELSGDELLEIAEYAKHYKLGFMCSCFNEWAFHLTLPHVSMIKIASRSANNKRLLNAIAGSRKYTPIAMSTGMSTTNQIRSALSILKGHYVSLLHCVSKYPCHKNESNLGMISTLKEAFHNPVGYSDHCIGTETCKMAMALGAVIIEKHFDLPNRRHLKDETGIGMGDHCHSADYKELKDIVEYSKRFD